MGEMSIPKPDDSGRLLEPFINQARKKLEGEPDRSMVARVARDSSYDEWSGAMLRPAASPFGSTLLGRPPIKQKPIASMVLAVVIPIPIGLAAQMFLHTGAIAETQFNLIMVALAITILVAGCAIGVTEAFGPKPGEDVWVLPRAQAGDRPNARARRDHLEGGDESRLVRHSAAALWDLHAGSTSRMWKSASMAEWRSGVDLRAEASETIRAAGALQDLRRALGDIPVHLDAEAQTKWRDDYAVYQAGLSSLRERVEQQVALQMVVEAIGRQLDTPSGERAALADRIAATIPGNELAVEHLAEINTQSADLLALLNLQSSSIEVADSRTSAPNNGQAAATQAAESPLRHGE
ncbi:hypothetical protein ACQREA_17155 [Dietzia cinnamea]|uniref:hypothetical protein n=1 Tax=Dietzia TaxID=37914 RepID=UPI000D090114|nr:MULTISPECIES: hypothetical protein [Dietzia]AVM66123.1 hypothetical protein C3V38_16320 [Dietzia sp. oral taxon 368]MCT1886780.1 hypothetical protein [Dietzia cinnamea]